MDYLWIMEWIMSGHWSGRAAEREGGWPGHLQVTSPAADNRRRLESHLRPANTGSINTRHIPPPDKTQLFLLPSEVANRAGNHLRDDFTSMDNYMVESAFTLVCR